MSGTALILRLRRLCALTLLTSRRAVGDIYHGNLKDNSDYNFLEGTSRHAEVTLAGSVVHLVPACLRRRAAIDFAELRLQGYAGNGGPSDVFMSLAEPSVSPRA